ncbi:MAG: response regulator [Clostridiales bacterium]|nr:response regulator [Clostridiales bacterium]
MYKLLIVEDEIWEREGLVDFIDWRQLNIQIVGTASNGIQGLKMAKLHQPDIIITDIRMPILDGLELSKRVKFFLPQCKIIIITGYDDFEYARDAIHAGVYNYLLKPVQKKELLNTINRVIKDILQEKKHVEQIHILKQQVTERMYAERERFLLNLIRNDLDYSQSRDRVQDLRITFFEQDAVAIIIRFDPFYFCHNREYKEKQLCYRETYRKVQARIGNEGIVAMDDSENHDIVLCIPIRGRERDYINSIVFSIIANCKLKPAGYAVGVGSICKGLSKYKESYLQAKFALDNIFFNEEASILFFEDIAYREEMDEEDISQFFTVAFSYSKRILDGVISSNKEDVIAIVEELFEYIYSCPVDKNLVCTYFTSLIKEIAILMPSISEYLNPVNNIGEEALLLNSFIKLNGLKKWILNLLTYANNHFTQMRINKEKDIVEKVIDIMIHEYHRNIGIDIIAHRLGLSPNYLSSLFKQHTGKRFTEALTELRMKKAKEFLVSGNESIMDIAKSVGFTSASYFCTVFKKIYETTPTEYRVKYSHCKEKQGEKNV